MARLSIRNNPTSLKEIDRKRIVIRVEANGGARSFNLARLDLSGMGIDPSCKVICIARSGKTSKRFSLGTVDYLDRKSFLIDDLDSSEPVRFRILVREVGNPRLIASAENLKPHSDEDAEGESLIPVEPVSLGQLLWKLEVTGEGPVLKVNAKVFPHAAVAQNDIYFSTLVLPEAFRNVLDEIVRSPEGLDDETDWMWPWGDWLENVGAGRPPESSSDAEMEEWKEGAIEAFCNRHRFASILGAELDSKGEGGGSHAGYKKA